jgi:polysaccharide export outer membrane protein
MLCTSPLTTATRARRLACALAFVAGIAAHAQQQSSTPPLQTNPLVTLQAFEPPADQPYELGRGDAISIDVLGRPELSGKHVIGPDGDITLPLIGTLQLAGKTREQAANAIRAALGTFYNDVVVSVSVDTYTSNQILVLGAVEHPGIMTFDKTPTLLEAVSRAGTLPEALTTGGSNSGTKPSGVPDEVMIYRGNDTMVTVQLRALLESGSPLADMRLKRDDVVYVSGRTSYVSVLGQVTHPGNERLEPASTLSDLLAEAGGPTQLAGRNPTIEIIHRSTAGSAHPQIIAFNDMLRHRPNDVSLQTGDIIFVPESGFNGVAYTFDHLAPLVNLFTVGALIANP